MHLHGYLNEWRKNPHWSFPCCLALFLPLIDLPGEISGLVGGNVINNQLQTGDIEMPTIVGAVQESGAIDISIEEGKQSGGSALELKHNSLPNAQYNNNNKTHQGTQTKLFTASSMADVVFHEPFKEIHYSI